MRLIYSFGSREERKRWEWRRYLGSRPPDLSAAAAAPRPPTLLRSESALRSAG